MSLKSLRSQRHSKASHPLHIATQQCKYSMLHCKARPGRNSSGSPLHVLRAIALARDAGIEPLRWPLLPGEP